MAPKTTEVKKAAHTASRVKQHITKKTHKLRTKPRFFRPATKTIVRAPKYARKLAHMGPSASETDKYTIILRPLSSEKASYKLENNNTMTFMVAIQANKNQIREAFAKMYGHKVRHVRTLITPQGKKKAYIRLLNDQDALKIANEIQLI